MLVTSALNDFATSVEKSLSEIDSDYQNFNGIVVTGTHSPSDIEAKLDLIKIARQNKIPFLGICMGLQLMVIEYVRNVLGIKDATSEEFKEEGKKIVVKMPGLRVGQQAALWVDNRGQKQITNESFWHNYRVNIQEFPMLWDHFIIGEANDVVTFMRLKDHPHFVGVQFHPEYQSSKESPHPILSHFLHYAKTF